MGRITVGHTIAQFSAKLKCPPDLWDERKGRLKGESTEALRLNRAVEKINLSIHNHYKALTVLEDLLSAEAVQESE